MSILSESISLRSWTKEKNDNAEAENRGGKESAETKVAAIPRQAMRGVLRAREDGRQRVRKDSAEGGQYQEAAGLEERRLTMWLPQEVLRRGRSFAAANGR